MKLVALFSGGKDSVFAISKAKEMGHETEKLATAVSSEPESFLFQTSVVGLTFMQSRILNMQLISKGSTGMKDMEHEDLKVLLTNLNVDGVVCGIVKDKKQKKMIEEVCKELDLKLVAPLWGKKPKEILKEMLEVGFEIMITSVKGKDFDESWLGRMLDEKCLKEILKKKKFSLNDEDGMLGTLVLNCPIFYRKLEITKAEKVWKDDHGVYKIEDAKFVDKA